jgi:hypothetical protein
VKIVPLLALTMAFASPALAQEAKPTCPALPPELAAWASPTPLAAATKPADLAKAVVTIGSRTDLALAPTPKVSFATAPNKAPAETTSSGMASFTVAAAGTYRIALGTSAWINVAKDGAFQKSVAHTHQFGCAGIRKMVDFTLTPGAYVLQIEGGRDAAAGVLITKLP